MATQQQKELLIIKKLLGEVVESSKEMEAVPGDNPQIVELRKRAVAERKLAAAVLDALGGDLVQLRLYAKGK